MKRPRGLNKPKIAPASVNLPSKHDEVDSSPRRGVLFRCPTAATGCLTAPYPPPPQLLTASLTTGDGRRLFLSFFGGSLHRYDGQRRTTVTAMPPPPPSASGAATATLLLSFAVLLSTAHQAPDGGHHGSRIFGPVKRASFIVETCQISP